MINWISTSLTVKSILISAYTASIKLLAIVMLAFVGIDFHFLFYLFCLMLLLPEIGFLVSKSFRAWLKKGIEDNDEKFEKADFKDLIIHYSSSWCIKLFVIFGLLEAFYGIQVREVFVISSLAGAFGIEVVNFFVRRGEKKE